MTRRLLLLLLAIVILNAFLLAIDHEPSFLFGDSAVYLTTAIGKWIPPDRSFIYGLLLRPTAVWPRSLMPAIVLQVTCSAIASWLVGFCLLRYFAVRFEIAALCSVLCAIDPLQLMAARYILPDSLATSLFALFMTLSFSYLKTGSVSLLALIQIVAVALVSLRIGFLPIAVAMAVVLPLCTRRAVAFWKSAKRAIRGRTASVNWMRGIRYVGLPLVFSIMLNQSVLSGYRYLYGEVSSRPPAYLYRAGLFMLGDFAPLVKAVDYPVASERELIFGHLKYSLSDLKIRPAQRWAEGGLCDAILKSSGGDEDLADTRARETATRAIERDPSGVLKLAAETYAEYFNLHELQQGLLVEQGRYYNALPRERAMINDVFGTDVQIRGFDSLTKWLQSHSVLWCWFLLAFPLFYMGYLALSRHLSPVHLVSLLCAFLLILIAVVPVDHPTTRYLIPLGWLEFVIAGSLFRRSRARQSAPTAYLAVADKL